jgi:hypothetical protein
MLEGMPRDDNFVKAATARKLASLRTGTGYLTPAGAQSCT